MLSNTDNITVGSRGGVGRCLTSQVNLSQAEEEQPDYEAPLVSSPKRHPWIGREHDLEGQHNQGFLTPKGSMSTAVKKTRLPWHPEPGTSWAPRPTSIFKFGD